MRSEALPGGWSTFQAVLPFLPGKEKGSALRLDTTPKKSNSWIFTVLPTLSVTPGCSSHTFLLVSGGAHGWVSCFEMAFPREDIPALLWMAAWLIPSSLGHGTAGHGWQVPGQRKEASYWNTKGATAVSSCPHLCFLGTLSVPHNVSTRSLFLVHLPSAVS